MAGFFEKLGNKLDMVAEKVWKNREYIAGGLITGASIFCAGYLASECKEHLKEQCEEPENIPGMVSQIVRKRYVAESNWNEELYGRICYGKAFDLETDEAIPGTLYFGEKYWHSEIENQVRLSEAYDRDQTD